MNVWVPRMYNIFKVRSSFFGIRDLRSGRILYHCITMCFLLFPVSLSLSPSLYSLFLAISLSSGTPFQKRAAIVRPWLFLLRPALYAIHRPKLLATTLIRVCLIAHYPIRCHCGTMCQKKHHLRLRPLKLSLFSPSPQVICRLFNPSMSPSPSPIHMY